MGWLRFMVINIILVLIYLVIATGVFHSPEPGFVYDFDKHLKFNEVVAASDEAVVVVGAVKGSSYEQGLNAFVAKINTAGEILWSQSFGGAGDDEFYSIKQTTDGFLLAGTRAKDLDLSTDAYVVKIDSTGQKQWAKKFSTQFNSSFNDLKVDHNGDVVLVGEIEYATADNNLNTNAYVVKVDQQGQKKWSKKFGGANFTSAQAIVGAQKQNYYIAGHTNNEAGQKSWLLKMTNDKQEWSKNYFTGGSSSFYSLEQLQNGQLLAVGEANDENSCGYVVQIDQQGQKIKENLVHHEESSYSSFHTALEFAPQEIMVGGVIAVPLEFGNLDSISYQNIAYVVQLDDSLKEDWSKKFASKKAGILRGSAKINAQQIALVGNISQYEVDSEGYLIILDK